MGNTVGTRIALLLLLAVAVTIVVLRYRTDSTGDSSNPSHVDETLTHDVQLPKAQPKDTTVVLVILDTVRADHISSCGYSRPTTPFFDSLVARSSAASCDAYSPGNWTLPSHASYFTGKEVTEHGAELRIGGGAVAWGIEFKPLDEAFPVIAEHMKERGYQTVAISSNPVVAGDTGLLRGFDVTVEVSSFEELRGEHLVHALKKVLAEKVMPTEKPLFLFVNIADAHSPWAAIPAGVPWVPARPALDPQFLNPQNSSHRYLSGAMRDSEKQEFLQHFTDIYDYSVWRADQTLAGVMGVLESSGWLSKKYRLVVTSDHGESLGEHQLVGHGTYLDESTVRVPFAYLSNEGPALSLDDKPWPALHLFHLLQGHSPPVFEQVVSVDFPSAQFEELFGKQNPIFGQSFAAAWAKNDKVIWGSGKSATFHRQGSSFVAIPKSPQHDDLIERATREGQLVEKLVLDGDGLSQEMSERLKALGYVQ